MNNHVIQRLEELSKKYNWKEYFSYSNQNLLSDESNTKCSHHLNRSVSETYPTEILNAKELLSCDLTSPNDRNNRSYRTSNILSDHTPLTITKRKKPADRTTRSSLLSSPILLYEDSIHDYEGNKEENEDVLIIKPKSVSRIKRTIIIDDDSDDDNNDDRNGNDYNDEFSVESKENRNGNILLSQHRDSIGSSKKTTTFESTKLFKNRFLDEISSYSEDSSRDSDLEIVKAKKDTYNNFNTFKERRDLFERNNLSDHSLEDEYDSEDDDDDDDGDFVEDNGSNMDDFIEDDIEYDDDDNDDDAIIEIDKNQFLNHKNREKITQSLFEEYNKTAFKNQLPFDLPILWSNKLLTTAGRTKAIPAQSWEGVMMWTHSIELSIKVCDSIDRLKNTLLHELCHVAVNILDGKKHPPHGRRFKYWASRAMKAFPGVKITTYHNYAIHKPYQWQCTNSECKEIHERHTKKIGTREKEKNMICGICEKGSLHYMGTINREGMPRKPRAISAFSLFIKENFASVKNSMHPSTSHKEIMNQLVEMYKLFKVTT